MRQPRRLFHPVSFDGPCVFLENRLVPGGPAQLFVDPVSIVRCDDTDALDEALLALESGLSKGLHAAGLMSYELGYALEPGLRSLMPAHRLDPLLWFGLFRDPVQLGATDTDGIFNRLPPPLALIQVELGMTAYQHTAALREIFNSIESGELYQANFTFPVRFRYTGDHLALYARWRRRQPVAHGGFAIFDGTKVLSVSPELWIECRDGSAMVRPMKGTAARGQDALADRDIRATLAGDPKQRAENIMIVDLMRNDLGRISRTGSVHVPKLCTVETYPDFHALTSTIRSTIRPQVRLRDRLAALFPCGSIVGAPMIRAAQVLRRLEREPRGFYTGALGYIAPNGDCRFNVAIRTAVIRPDGSGAYGIGGGIVADSDAADEYEEALLKARLVLDDR